METKQRDWVRVVFVFVLMAGVGLVFADGDPNDPQGQCYSSSGFLESSGPCPSWVTVLDRNSTDAYTNLHLVAKLDACQIISHDVNSIEQNTPTPIIIELKKDDIWIEWDEDAGDGNRGDFTFTGDYTTDPNVADPNTGYLWVSSTNDNIINWTVYQADENGTLTITDTTYNEHDVIHLHRNHIGFTKVDDVDDLDCRSENQAVEYTICWDNNGVYDFEDCVIIDFLPDGVDFVSADPQGVYDPNIHAFFWEIDTIAAGDANCVTLDVTVNDKAEPGMYEHNVAELYSGESLIARDFEDTLICCQITGDPNIIFVDISAVDGGDNGLDWQNAYHGSNGLQKALARIRNTECVPGPNTIYCAQGTYDPNETPDDTFALTDGLSVYGGFKSGGSALEYRDPKLYETILTGLIDEQTLAVYVVTMADNTLIDGFTVTQALENAVYGSGVDFEVANCTIEKSFLHGIQADGGDVTVKWCKVLLNERHGIYHSGAGYTLTVENSWLLRNGEIGIWCENSTPTMKNSVISESSFIKAANAGIRIENPTGKPKLHNLTISNNRAEGVFFEHTDPNYFLEENSANRIELQNCIVYFNNGSGPQFSPALDLNLDRVAHYSCISDCNSVNNNTNAAPLFAYTIDPNGTPDPNNYHLHFDDTVCKNEGNLSLTYTGQVDMDNDSRDADGFVDIGADEVDCGDVSHPLDWNADGLVNLHEYSKFSQAWLGHDPNDPAWADPNLSEGWYEWKYICNLDETGDSQYQVDLADLMVLCEDDPVTWLWKACWKADGLYETMGMSGGGVSMMSMPIMETTSFESTAVEPVEEVDPYAEMSTSEVVSLVTGIHEIIDHIEIVIEEDRKNAKDLTDAIDFLEGVLVDIEVARQ